MRLTGMTPTGVPHLGHYVSILRNPQDSLCLVADYHAMVKGSTDLRGNSRVLHAAFEATGADPTKIYTQSSIPEVLELYWILNCMTPKGMLNRSHAYFSALQGDQGRIQAGLFNYPVLMAADILLVNADTVVIGRDQLSHMELAAFLANRFNKRYGEVFRIPTYEVTDILPGRDGLKMGKSAGNSIPLFSSPEQLLKDIKGIKTDSRLPGEPKDIIPIFDLWKAFATEEQTGEMRVAFREGIGWGDFKVKLFNLINDEIKDARERYYELMSKPYRPVNDVYYTARNTLDKVKELVWSKT